MLDFEHMVLPAGKTVDSVISESIEAIAEAGSRNARFSTVSFAGMKQIIANPDVEKAWESRQKNQSAAG